MIFRLSFCTIVYNRCYITHTVEAKYSIVVRSQKGRRCRICNFFQPQFSYLEKKDNDSTYFTGWLWALNEIMDIKGSAEGLPLWASVQAPPCCPEFYSVLPPQELLFYQLVTLSTSSAFLVQAPIHQHFLKLNLSQFLKMTMKLKTFLEPTCPSICHSILSST